MTTAGRIARNAGALAGSQGVTLALNFVAWAHLARTLAPEGFGVLGFGTAMLAYFAVVVQLGFDAVVVREAARDPSRVPALAGSLTALRLLLCLVALAAYGAVVWALPRPPLVRAALLVQSASLVVLATRLSWVFQAVERMGAIAVRDAVTAALNMVAVVVLVTRPDQIVLAAALTAAVPLAGNVWLWVAYQRAFGRLRLRVDLEAWAALLRPALPLAASAFLIEIYLRMNQVMLEVLYTTAAVGLYSAAVRLIGIAQVPAVVAYGAFFPSLAAAYGDRERMRASGRMLAGVLFAVGLPIAVAGPWLAEDALVFAFGAPYAPAAPALAVLLVNVGVVYVNMAVGTPLMAWDLQTPYMWAVLGGAVTNVALSVVLIPRYGLVGAAVSTLASEAVVCVGLCWLYRRTTGELPLRAAATAVPVAVAAAVPAALGAALGWPLLVAVTVSIAAAGAAAWSLGVVSPSVFRRLSPSTPPTSP